MTKTPFLKMHGTGNDFVVLDARAHPISMNATLAAQLSHRQFGIGCDQLLLLEKSDVADVRMRIFNADGSEISTCGNATRCMADFVMREAGKDTASIETAAGIRTGTRVGESSVQVDMGAPQFDWQAIPLSESRNTLHLGLQEGLLMDPVAVSMGNPHAIFFVRDLKHIKMAEAGPKLEHHPLFPQRANISAVQVIAPDHLRMVVWERGTGLTMACGSAACAAVVAGALREVSLRKATVELPGGTLEVEWTADDRVLMSGPVAYVFNGEIAL
ncbi:MAG: diaminopimelate epimerase [Azospirillum brasilense]|nr:MAG: diaminopimelate epimerase [Azospirillum brasilense]